MATLIERIQTVLSPLAAGKSWYSIYTIEPAVYPFIVFQRIVSTVNNTLSGPSELQNTRVQIDVYSRQIRQADAVATAVATAMTTAAAFTAVQLSSQDLYETETKAYRCSADFSVWSSTG